MVSKRGRILVAPYWNLNPCATTELTNCTVILVAPYWNLNGIEVIQKSYSIIKILVAPYWNLNDSKGNPVVTLVGNISSSILEFK